MEPDIENAIFIDKQVYLKFLENKIFNVSGFDSGWLHFFLNH